MVGPSLQMTKVGNQAEQTHGLAIPAPGPENRQRLKREQWTRIVRVGEEYAGTARLHSILTDMISFAEAMTESEEESQMDSQEFPSRDKPWALFFNAEACDEEHAGKTLEDMELPAA